jgi:HAAS
VSAIADYLDSLEQELRVKRAPRRRLLAEVEDHLRSCADELGADVDGAEAERQAIERFGAAATVARHFAHTVAAASARRSAYWLGLAFAAYATALVAFALTADARFTDFPQGAPSALALQVGAIAAALSLVRALRWRREPLIPEDRVRLLANGAAVGVIASGGGLALEALIATTRPAGALPWGERPLLLALFALAVGASAAAALATAAAAFRSSTLAALPGRKLDDHGPVPSLVEDAATLIPVVRRPLTALFARPAVLVVLTASLAAAAVLVSQTIGRDFANHASIALPALTLALFEAAMIGLGYHILGPMLGLRGGMTR